MVTGLFTEEKDGLFSDWHEDNIINPFRGLLFGISWSPGLKTTPAGWVASGVAGLTGAMLGAVMFAEKFVFEPISQGKGKRSGSRFANPTPGMPEFPSLHGPLLRKLKRKYKNSKNRKEIIQEILETVYNDTAVYYEEGTFGVQHGDFSISFEGVCPPGYTYDSDLGMCVPND